MKSHTVVLEASKPSEAFSDLVYDASSAITSLAVTSQALAVKKTCESFTIEFSALSAKTARATLEMCKVVSEAKAALSQSEFAKFCESINQKEEDSTIRKYLAIGSHYDAFIAYADRLPNSWTSIYLITQIPADKFDELIAKAASLKSLTAVQIKKLLDPAYKVQPKLPSDAAVKIFFTKELTVTQWNTLKLRLDTSVLLAEPLLPIRIEFTESFLKRHERLKKKNGISAKMSRRAKKEQQRIADQRDYVLHPMFTYSDYNVETGEFMK